MYIVFGLPSFDDVEEAKSVENSVIPTEVGCALLMTFSLIEVIFGIVDMRNLIR